jgi:hypothetical protein
MGELIKVGTQLQQFVAVGGMLPPVEVWDELAETEASLQM